MGALLGPIVLSPFWEWGRAGGGNGTKGRERCAHDADFPEFKAKKKER